MNTDVKKMMDSKIDIINNYYDIPENMKDSYDTFVSDMTQLGESCQSWEEFEEKFKSDGIEEQFNNLLIKCTPKAQGNTDYFQGYKNKNILKGMAKGAIKTSIQGAMVDLESEAYKKRREAMIEADVFDDYNRASNKIDDVGRLAKFIGRKFGKK